MYRKLQNRLEKRIEGNKLMNQIKRLRLIKNKKKLINRIKKRTEVDNMYG